MGLLAVLWVLSLLCNSVCRGLNPCAAGCLAPMTEMVEWTVDQRPRAMIDCEQKRRVCVCASVSVESEDSRGLERDGGP